MTPESSPTATRDVVAVIAATPAAQALKERIAEGGALCLSDVAAPAWPFLVALLQRWFPHRPIVVVTHDSDIAAFATRNIHFKDGRLVKDMRIDQPRRAKEELDQMPVEIEQELVAS